MKLNVQRLFVGNLPTDITEKDIKHRFVEYGNIQSIEIKNRPDGSVFAYINLEADRRHIDECLETLPKKKWKGHNVKVELAKESFLVRLARERKEQKSATEQNRTPVGEVSTENLRKRKSSDQSEDANSFQIITHSQAKQPRNKLETEDTRPDEPLYNKKLPMFRGIVEYDSYVKAESHEHCEPQIDAKFSSRIDANNKVRKNENLKLYSIHNNQSQLLPHKMRFKSDNGEHQKQKNSDFQFSEVAQNHKKNVPSVRSRISEDKRLKSIEEKRKSFSNQLQTVKRALSAVDVPINKKIVFSDEETSDDDLHNKHDGITGTEDNKVVDKTSLLFNDESSDDETNTFKIKTQFEGRKGQKLLELQSKYANDKRFTLDERFYESDESETAQDPPNGDVCGDEKQRQLNILQEVLGERVHMPLDKKEKPRNNSFMLRFDPLKEDHKRFEVAKESTAVASEEGSKNISSQKAVKKQKNENKVVENVETPKVEVSKEKFYTVTDRLKETLDNKSKSDTQFSLLEMFGSTGHDEGESPVHEKYEHSQMSKKKQTGWQRNPFKYDSSDSEEEESTEHPKQPNNKISESYLPKTNSESYKCFFFKENDARLKEGLEFLISAKKMGEEEFAKKRRELKQIVRSKIKNNLRKKKPWKKKLGGQKKKFSKKKR